MLPAARPLPEHGMQIITPSKVYPVIVIGSGASGGMAAWNLTSKGIDVLVLDDDSDRLPGSKFLQPPPEPRCGERLLQKAAGTLGIPVVAGRRANMTRPTRGFPACH